MVYIKPSLATYNPRMKLTGILLHFLGRQNQVKEMSPPEVGEAQVADKLHEIDVSKIPSPVLARLIEEVRNEEMLATNAYNRYHNRHNRSR